MAEAYTGDYAAIRSAAESTFRDKCKIGTATRASGYEPNALTWTYGSEIACGFDAAKSTEVSDGSAATMTDAVCRIGLSNTITGHNRIQVTERNTTDVTEYYAIIGEPRRGLSCWVLNLKRLTGNSAI